MLLYMYVQYLYAICIVCVVCIVCICMNVIVLLMLKKLTNTYIQYIHTCNHVYTYAHDMHMICTMRFCMHVTSEHMQCM